METPISQLLFNKMVCILCKLLSSVDFLYTIGVREKLHYVPYKMCIKLNSNPFFIYLLHCLCACNAALEVIYSYLPY